MKIDFKFGYFPSPKKVEDQRMESGLRIEGSIPGKPSADWNQTGSNPIPNFDPIRFSILGKINGLEFPVSTRTWTLKPNVQQIFRSVETFPLLLDHHRRVSQLQCCQFTSKLIGHDEFTSAINYLRWIQPRSNRRRL